MLRRLKEIFIAANKFYSSLFSTRRLKIRSSVRIVSRRVKTANELREKQKIAQTANRNFKPLNFLKSGCSRIAYRSDKIEFNVSRKAKSYGIYSRRRESS